MARKKSGEDKPAVKRDPNKRRAGANIPLAAIAAMPEVKQPSAHSAQETIKVQKPDIALPQEALLKARRTGSVAPLEEFTAKSKAKTTPTGKPIRKGPPGRPGEVVPADTIGPREAPGKVRGKRDKESGEGFDSDLGSTRQTRKKLKDKEPFGGRRVGQEDEVNERQRQYRRRPVVTSQSTAAPRKEKVIIQLPCTVRSFSEAA